MKIGFAQINPTVGALTENAALVLESYRRLQATGAELVLTPELALTGYPPQDLLFQSGFVEANIVELHRLAEVVQGTPLVVGYVDFFEGTGRPFRNGAAVLRNGKVVEKVFKSLLPTYDVFDEARYFEPAPSVTPVELLGRKVGITLCEDLWDAPHLPRAYYTQSPVDSLVAQGAELILNLSASPFTMGKPRQRLEMISGLARRHGVPIAYCNCAGANDQLVFDGHSLLVGADGLPRLLMPGFESAAAVGDLNSPSLAVSSPQEEECLWNALVLGVRDYFKKCGFQAAVLGLSGGVDSAVVACIAAAALGPEKVLGVTMPTRYSSEGSVTDSQKLASTLGLDFLNVPIDQAFEVFEGQFARIFQGLPGNETEENMQPRLRGMTLMALANKFGRLVLSTGNKSELAVGYCTLYGDMCGALSVISDVSKTDVYRLARWINRAAEVIPNATLEKAPSAELKPNQRDQDTLPPYEVLDPILKLYVEEMRSKREIVAFGFDEATVDWVLRKVRQNEYKRVQAAPGLKVTARAFGMGRRIPVAQRFEP
jgi:NAD+ synthase (glutamine-hydrolysing)